MSLPKCLVVDPMHDSLFAMMKEIGWDVDFQPHISRDEIRKIHHGYDGLIVRTKTFIDRDLLGDSPTIKFVGRAGAGLDNLDLEYLAARKIRVLHASEGNRDAVGEYAVGALLSLLRNIPRADQQVRALHWDRERNRGEEIMDKTITIIGYGNMGMAFARRLSGFGCNVLAYDKYKTNYSDQYARAISFEEVFDRTDILSLHVPLTAETKGMVDEKYLRRFRKSIVLVNSARGEIVSLSGLSTSFHENNVRGAVLDVLENEKLNTLTEEQLKAFNSLKERYNVIFTPHIAGWTFESHVKINVALVSKIKSLREASDF